MKKTTNNRWSRLHRLCCYSPLYKMDGKNSIDFKLASFYLKTFYV